MKPYLKPNERYQLPVLLNGDRLDSRALVRWVIYKGGSTLEAGTGHGRLGYDGGFTFYLPDLKKGDYAVEFKVALADGRILLFREAIGVTE